MTDEAPYFELFNANPQPMLITDRDSLEILAVNEAAIREYGYTHEEFLRLTIKDLRPEEDVPRLIETLTQSDESFRRHGVHRHRRKDGRLKYVEVIANHVTFDGRQAALVMAIDVTARREAEAAAQRAQALLRIAGRVAKVGGWSYSLRTRRFEWSDELNAIFQGSAKSSTSIREALSFIVPEWRNLVRSSFEGCLRDGLPVYEEIEAITIPGRRIWIRISAERVSDEAGNVTGVEGAVQNITDEHEARAWSEERLRRFLDAIPTPIWSATPHGKIDYVNKALCDYANIEPDLIDPNDLRPIVHPEDFDRVFARSAEAFRNGVANVDEVRLRHHEGGFRWNLISSSPLWGHDGQVIKHYGSLADIHDIKLAQAALFDREKRLNTIFEHVPECVKLVGADGTLLDINEVGLAMIGAEAKSDVVGLQTESLIHPDDRETFSALHRSSLEGKSGRATFRIIGLHGDERWAESHSTPLSGVGGRIDEVLSVTRDITERRQSETALIETLNRNESVLAATVDGIHGFDSSGRVIFENAAAVAMLGCAKGESHANVTHEMFHHHRADAQFDPIDACPVCQTLRDGETRKVEDEVFYRKDGSSFPVEYTVTAMRDAAGSGVTGAVVTFRDVTVSLRESALHALEARVLEMVSASAGLPEILEEITRTVDRLIPGVRSSIHLIDDMGCLRLGAAPAMPAEFRDMVDGLQIGENVGSCGTAAWRREPVMVVDTRAGPLWADFPELIEKFDIRASWSIPVLDVQNAVLASFALYYTEPTRPSPDTESIVARVCQFVRTAIERQGASEALRTSEERFRTIAEHIDEVFWILDAESDGIVYVSPAFERVWQRACSDLYAHPRLWMDAIHPDDQERVAAAARRQKDGPYFEEYRILLPDGTVRWVMDRSKPVKGPDGRVSQVIGSARDVTIRKESEIDLRDRLKELNCLYRVSALTSDQEQPIDLVCTGIVDNLVAAMRHEEVAVARVRLGDREFTSKGWAQPVASLVAPIRRTDGETGSIEVAYTVERAETGSPHGPFLEEEFNMVQTVSRHLAEMLDHRDLAIKLTQSERLKAIGQLTGGVAHDFNNLLTVILGNAETLAESLDDDARLQSLAETTATAAERGAELANRLLAFARRQPLDPTTTDVNQRIIDMDGLLRRTLGEHVEFSIYAQPDLWTAMIDAAQMENAILNLCINARDAMSHGGKLVIETDNFAIDAEFAAHLGEVDPGDYVMIAVSDTGSGMSKETLRRAFEPFFTTKEVGRGSGLGLSMVYGFVKQSKGHIRIYSEPGQGTTVRLYLPRAQVDAPLPEPDPRPREIVRGEEKILLVEDDEPVRNHVRDQLLSLGYQVVAVHDGPAALKALSTSDDFSLLFTDVVMSGGMNGNELANAALELRPNVPVLLTSGYTEVAAGIGGRLNGGTNLLQKPYRRQELATKIRSAIDGAIG